MADRSSNPTSGYRDLKRRAQKGEREDKQTDVLQTDVLQTILMEHR